MMAFFAALIPEPAGRVSLLFGGLALDFFIHGSKS
jgi:hypothetical protein